MPENKNRAAGLDTLRATAISLVFIYHYACFVSDKPRFGWISEIGWTGVDLFFVLSGYLIANQLFKGLADGRRFSLKWFYLRRAFRTLPVFWLVLAAYWIFPADLGGKTPPPLWRFLTFTHNLGLRPGTAFSHAWSLSVEEQFYLFLPLTLALAITLALWRPALALTRGHGWALLFALTCVGMATRAFMWSYCGRKADGHVDEYMTAVYYSTWCRFDEFIPGIAVAMLRNFHQDKWAWLMARGNWILAIGLASSLTMLTVADHNWIRGYGYPFFMTAFGYSLLALSFGLLVMAALSPRTVLNRARIPAMQSIALWSYSIYLSHRPVANILNTWATSAALSDGSRFALVTAGCVVAGGLLYRLVEAPFMALRDRLVPTIFRVPAGTSGDRTIPPRLAREGLPQET